MENIRIIPDIGPGFGAPIKELFRVWAAIIGSKDQRITLDFSTCRFSNPFFLLGISLLYKYYTEQGQYIKMNLDCSNAYFANYLNLIYFCDGLQPDTDSHEIQSTFNNYRYKTYLPLINFPYGDNNIETSIRDRLLEFISLSVKERLHLDGNLQSAVAYLMDEAVNNIKDHAKTDKGYLFTQFYPKKEFLDFCIADTGISILGSYHSAGRVNFDSHDQAIQAALNGESSKEDKNRGFGICTSRRMLVNGLGGCYFLMSGNAFIFSHKGTEEIRVLPDVPGLTWPGTYIALRIPVKKFVKFNISHYYE